MLFNQMIKKAEPVIREHSTTILTGVGVIGTIGTAVLTGRATVKAVRILDEFRESHSEIDEETQDSVWPELEKSETIKLVWAQYIPPAACGGLTIASIIMANRISSKQIAALAAMYGISERRLADYKDKVAEKFGPGKSQQVGDEIAQDRVNNTHGTEVIITGDGTQLCFDLFGSRYFENTVEGIKQAVNLTNQELLNSMYASLSTFYDEIGLPPTGFSDTVGWNVHTTGLVEVVFSTVMSKDNRPCIAVDFTNPPVTDYSRTF